MIDYLKDKKLYIILTILIIVILNVNLALYQINLEIIIYGDILCLLIMIIFTIYDYYCYQKHLKEVKLLHDNIEYNNEYYITKNKIELEYQKIVDDLKLMINDIKEKDTLDKISMNEYYTMWVHQIKTPIAAMKLILEDKNDIDLSIELSKIEQYVEMVLSYIRLNSESSDYVFREVDLNAIIKENIKANMMVFIKKKIHLEYDEIDYHFISDDKWLSFAIGQILSNALKYTKTNGTIKIEFKNQILSIIDNGIGIYEEDLPRIFEKGYSGIIGREDKKATGIGLYLTKTILDRLNHPIWIESKVNEGTRVNIKLVSENKYFD